MTPQSILAAAVALVQKANQLGVAAETALLAFQAKLFPASQGGTFGDSYGALSADGQAAVDEAVSAAQAGS